MYFESSSKLFSFKLTREQTERETIHQAAGDQAQQSLSTEDFSG